MGNQISQDPFYGNALQQIHECKNETNPLYAFWKKYDLDVKSTLEANKQEHTTLNRLVLGNQHPR